jgi:hypothetical protein
VNAFVETTLLVAAIMIVGSMHLAVWRQGEEDNLPCFDIQEIAMA